MKHFVFNRRTGLAGGVILVAVVLGVRSVWLPFGGVRGHFGILDADLAALSCEQGHGTPDGPTAHLDPSAARTALDRINSQLALKPFQATLLSQKVHLGLQVDVIQAIDACRSILERDPGNAFALGHLASAYLVQGQYEAAMYYAAIAVERRPGPDSWNLLATVFLNKNQYDQAEMYFGKSLEKVPGHAAASAGLAKIALRRSGAAIP